MCCNKIIAFCCCAILCLGIASCQTKDNAQTTEPLHVLFDTDLGNDIDDLLALQMLINYEKEGKIDIKGITVCKANPLAMAVTRAYYNKYGVGSAQFGYVYEGPNTDEGNFLRKIFPVLCDSTEERVHETEAYIMMRKVLAESADHSVNIIATGPMTNIARLLESKADSISPLNGEDLIKQKVCRLDFMGGNFSTNHEAEWNILQDSVAARKVIESWPTQMVASGFEVGDKVRFPVNAISMLEENHPLRVGYENFLKMPYNRPCWDLIPILNLIEQNKEWLQESENGNLILNERCCTRFVMSSDGNHKIVELATDSLPEILAKKVTN